MKKRYGLDSDGNVIPREATHIKDIFSMYAEGNSLKKISEYLASKGIPSPLGKDTWSNESINGILNNTLYLQRIVNFDLFEVVQLEKQCRKEATARGERYNSDNPIQNYLFCAQCGSSYRRIKERNGVVNYRCSSHVESGKQVCKKAASIPEQSVLTTVANYLNVPVSSITNKILRKSIAKILVLNTGKLAFIDVKVQPIIDLQSIT